MALQDKYKELIDTARSSGVTGLQVREQDNILYIDGEAPSGEVKNSLWDVYNKIDPDFRAGDVILNVNATAAAGELNVFATLLILCTCDALFVFLTS